MGAGLGGASHQFRRVAGTAGADSVPDIDAGNLAGHFDNLSNGKSRAVPQIESLKPFSRFRTEATKCCQVGRAEVVHMDVVPDAGPVSSGEIISKGHQSGISRISPVPDPQRFPEH